MELICRLLALLRLYGTSFWSTMQARVRSPVQPRGVSVQALGSQHSIMSYCLSLTVKHIQKHLHIKASNRCWLAIKKYKENSNAMRAQGFVSKSEDKFPRTSWGKIVVSIFERCLLPPGHYEPSPVCSPTDTATRTHTSLSHIVDHVWFSCSLALTLIQSRLVEICSPCCLIFPPLATFPGTAPLPHRVAQAGLAWPQHACQVCSLSSSPSNLFPYARSMDSALQITRAPLPPATA